MVAQSSTLNPQLAGLPHREPFVFVHDVILCESGRAECAAKFAAADPMFAGHFPGNPLVPGVILTEALAQTAGIAAASIWPRGTAPLFLLSGIRTMKFLRPVRPEELINLRAEKLAEIGELMQFAVEARVGNALVAEGQLVLSISKP
jgi:3-hydroxyacyl-[acyl-carrier-protein] dehydratase